MLGSSNYGSLISRTTLRSPWKFILRVYPTFLPPLEVVARGENKVRFWEDWFKGYERVVFFVLPDF